LSPVRIRSPSFIRSTKVISKIRLFSKEQFKEILQRFKAISGSLEDITLVFDQGNNSKKMLGEVSDRIYFVGTLSPFHHKALIEEAKERMTNIPINEDRVKCFRSRTKIWQLDLTSVVYISEKLRQGQIRGIHQEIEKLFCKLNRLKEKIKTPTKGEKKRTEKELKEKITSLIASSTYKELIGFRLHHLSGDAFKLDFWVNEEEFNHLKEQ